MRKLRAGLGSLALAAGLATTYALSAPAAPPAGTSAQRAVVDELPNPAEEKRRALREVALQKVLAGDVKVRQRGASEVVKVADDQYVELARE
jgi:immune inhibitor A